MIIYHQRPPDTYTAGTYNLCGWSHIFSVVKTIYILWSKPVDVRVEKRMTQCFVDSSHWYIFSDVAY